MRVLTERLPEIVCKAAHTIPEAIKQVEPGIDWRKMIAFGNGLRHAYHPTTVERVCDIVQNSVPPLKSFFERRIRACGS